MTKFREAIKALVDSPVSDQIVKDLLREMLCKSKESDCDAVNRFFKQPYVVGDFPTRNNWVS